MFSAFCHHSHIRGYIVKTDIYRHQYFFEKEEVFLCDVLPLHVEVYSKLVIKIQLFIPLFHRGGDKSPAIGSNLE